MGNFLSWPSTKKHCESGSNGRFIYGLAEMQGWRITMEDAHAAVLDLDGSGESSNAFFAVYDGHSGPAVAKYAGENLHKRLVAEENYKEKNWEIALKKAFLGIDEDLLKDPQQVSGCTAVAALVTNDDKIYVANAGDSRSVLSTKGLAKNLSFDHKPTNFAEKARISKAGGFIENYRVNGNLAMSRALGDFQHKRNTSLPPESQAVTADPDVTCHEVTEEDEFLVLACDGIWDCLTSQQVIDFVRYQVSEGKELTEICEMIFEHCLAPRSDSDNIGCDNMSLVVVGITHGRTKEGWYDWVKERVKNKYGYETPSVPPQLYSQQSLTYFRTRRKAIEAREKEIEEDARKEVAKEVDKEEVDKEEVDQEEGTQEEGTQERETQERGTQEKEVREDAQEIEAQAKETHKEVAQERGAQEKKSREEDAQEKELESHRSPDNQ